MDKKILKFQEIINLEKGEQSEFDIKPDDQDYSGIKDQMKIKHFDYVQIDNKIISVVSMVKK